MSRCRFVLVGGVLSALALAACSSGGGSGFPTTTATTPAGTTATSASAGGSDQIAQQLKALDPCSVIPDSEVSQLHLTRQGRDDLQQPVVGWGCKWKTSATDVGAANSYSVVFTIFPNDSATDLNTRGEQVTPVSTNGRPGLQLFNQLGCSVTMRITDTSSAEVTLSADPSKSCGLANDIAQLVEPKLPKG